MIPRQRGFSLIEVLVTIAILMIGLLGLAALQTNATVAEMEAYQRSQALILAQDMADRIAANKLNADSYLIMNTGATTATCPTTPQAAADLCEWGNKLAGAAEVTAGGTKVGAMIRARGCVTQPSPKVYQVTVTWQGMKPIAFGVLGNNCGAGLYGTYQRRLVSQIVRVGLLGTTS